VNEPERLTRNEARAGESPGIVRYILVIGLILVVLGFGAAFLFYR
jgi:hypothetical protein